MLLGRFTLITGARLLVGHQIVGLRIDGLFYGDAFLAPLVDNLSAGVGEGARDDNG